jgi:hypothetical protein
MDSDDSVSLRKISIQEYEKLSDLAFDSLTDSLEELTQAYDGEDADKYEVDYSVRAGSV